MLISHLQYFIAVVDTQSFTRASEKLFVSQSTISKAVRSLEKELQTVLISPYSRNHFITKSGEVFYQYAIDVLNYLDERKSVLITQLEKTDSKLTLGLPPTAGSIYFYTFISRFKDNYPQIELILYDKTSKYIPDMLLDGEIQLGIVIEPFNDDRFAKKTAYQSEAVLVVSDQHPLAKQDEVDFRELKNEKFIQISKEYMFYDVFLDFCASAGFKPQVIFENYHWDLVFEMVTINRGVTILPKPLVDKFSPDNVHALKLKNPTFPWSMTIIYPQNALVTKPMQNFISLIQNSDQK